jgi:DNA-binding transcriptional ArsR family regulator
MKTKKTPRKIEIPVALLADMAESLRVLAHPHRLKIVEMLDLGGSKPVHEIVDQLELPQGTVSNHLSKMRRAGIVHAERHGKEVLYRIANPNAITILDCIRRKVDET